MKVFSHRASRRGLLVAAVGVGFTVAAPRISRGAGKINLKLAMSSQATDPVAVRSMEAIKRIRDETSGDVQVQLFANGQLGAEPDVLNQIRMGGVDMFNVSTVILSTVVPQSSICSVGFAFGSYEDVWKAMDGDLGSYIRSQMGRANLVGLPRIWNFGFRYLSSTSKPIRAPADLSGFKIRVPSGPLYTSLFQALGAAPTTVQIAELYSSLRTGLVDGAELPLQTMAEFKIPEVQKYVSTTRHMWDGPWMLANKTAWDRLPTSIADIVQKNFDLAAVDQRSDIMKYDERFLAQKDSSSLTVIEVDRAAFQSKLKASGFYANWKEKFGPEAWAILEKYATGGL